MLAAGLIVFALMLAIIFYYRRKYQKARDPSFSNVKFVLFYAALVFINLVHAFFLIPQNSELVQVQPTPPISHFLYIVKLLNLIGLRKSIGLGIIFNGNCRIYKSFRYYAKETTVEVDGAKNHFVNKLAVTDDLANIAENFVELEGKKSLAGRIN